MHEHLHRQRLPEHLGQAAALEGELGDPARRHGRPQDGVAVDGRRRARAVPPRRRSPRRDTPGSRGPTRRCDRPRPGRRGGAAATVGQLVDAPGGDQATVVDDRHLLAEVLDQVELVAGEEHAAARPGPVRPGPARWRRCPSGRDPARGSSRTSSSGSWTSAAASWTRCWFPWESASTLLLGRSAISSRSSQPRARLGRGAAQAVQPSQVLDLLADQHAGVQAPLLGHVAEPAALGLTDRSAVPPHRRPRRDRSGRRSPAWSVVLPAPFGPRKPTTWPAGTIE